MNKITTSVRRALLARKAQLLLAGAGVAASISPAAAVELNEKCVINVLNRTVQVQADGNWALTNVPSNMGQIRARATCMMDDGSLVFGQSDYFTVTRNGISRSGDIKFAELDPIPSSLSFDSTDVLVLGDANTTHQLAVTAFYPDNSVKDVSAAATGINYSSTNADVAEVSADGLITAKANGSVLINARKDGVLVSRRVTVLLGGDQDGDGLPDDWERANGLNPNDPIDALEDHDKDGLTAKQEFDLGSDIHNADTDGDGISDLEESIPGDDGFITSPILADTDGDGIADGLEIAGGSDPNDSNSGNITDFLESITVEPSTVLLTYNEIDGESSTQLRVTGTMIDGSTLDLTSQSTGTRYATDDIRVANFGLNDGEIFAGENGNAKITITNNGKSFVVDVQVDEFTPQAQSALTLPGYGNNIDLQGNYIYVAAGDAGLQVVDVSNQASPTIVGSVDTSGVAIDVKVLGNYAYLADGLAGLRIIDISTPTNPVLVNTWPTSGLAMDVALKDDLAFVAIDTGGFEIFNIADPRRVFTVGQSSAFDNVVGLDVEGNYMAAVGGNALALFDIENPNSPIMLNVVNIGAVRDVTIHQGYVYVAAKTSGYRVYKITTGNSLELVGGDRAFIPWDVTVNGGLAFFADMLFNNVMAVVNVKDPDQPVFQDTIDFFAFGDYAGSGVTVNATHAYMVGQYWVVNSDYGDTGNTKLFTGQYRDINDINGVAPDVAVTQPQNSSVLVEGGRFILAADAQDDIAVQKVEFFVNGSKVGETETSPYRIPYSAPLGVNAMAITAVAHDLGGNTTTSAMVTVEVQKDGDNDGLGNEQELEVYLTKADTFDTDGDGLGDGDEVARGIDPNNPDSDGDGINDGDEVSDGTDPNNPDVTAPTVVDNSPVTDSVDIAENAPIIITFSEPLKVNSISNQAIEVLDSAGNPVAGSISLSGSQTELIFQAEGLLKEFELHNVTVGYGLRDTAGNVMNLPHQFSFTTGNIIDNERPDVLEVAPVANTIDAPVNVLVSVTMSERIDPATVNSDSFYITDTTTNTRIDGFVQVLDDNQTITFIPNQAFLVGRQHSISVRNTISDLHGNTIANNKTYYFTTAFSADGVAPTIVKTGFPNGQIDVPLNAELNVQLSETIDPYSIKNIKLVKDGVEVATNISLDNSGSLVTIEPMSILDPNAAYTLLIDQLEDLSGNILAVPFNLDFTTSDNSDTTAGGVEYYSPRNYAEVPSNTVVTIRYPGMVDFTSVNSTSFRLYNQTETRYETVTYTISADGREIYLSADELKVGHQYRYHTSNIKDLAGNTYSNLSSRYLTVTSNDDTVVPNVVAGNIANGAIDVATNSTLRLSFAEPVANQCVNDTTVKLLLDGVVVDSQVTVSTDGHLVTIDPNADLVANGNYQIVVDGVCDYAGNTLSAYTSSFTTGTTSDTTAATLTSITPAHNSTEVSVNSQIQMVFDEPLDPTNDSSNLRIYVKGMSSYIAGSFEFNDNTVTFTPTHPLPGNTEINIYLSNYRDIAGNTRNSTVYKFFTQAVMDQQGPQVATITPNDGAMDIGVNTPVVLTFNESLDGGTVNSTNFKLYNNGSIITPSVTRSPDSRTVTLRGTWPAGSPVSVLVTNEVKDLSGNAITDFASVFSTAVVDNDVTRPSVVRQYPLSGATDITNLDRISLYTNEVMQQSTLTDAFHVAENGVLVSGSIDLSTSGQVVTFTPDRPFTPGALVGVYLDSSALDDSGNAVNHYQGSFTMAVESNATVRPTQLTYIPANGSTDVPINSSIQVLYNQDLDEAFINETYITLRDTGGTIVPSTMSLSADKRIVTVTPNAQLQANSYYYVSLSGNIQDIDGETQYYNRTFNFTTSDVVDSQQPMVMAMTPGNNAQNVPLNPLYHVRYDEPINPLSIATGPSMSVGLSSDNKTLTYFRFEPLAANTSYNESPIAVKDMVGLDAVNLSQTFTTGDDVDVVVPHYSSYSPANGQTVAINTPVVWTMNDVIDPLTVNDSTVYVEDVYDSYAKVPGSVSLSTDGRTITWASDELLLVGRQYRARLLGVTDLSGNANSSDSFNFYTDTQTDVQAPSVAITSVTDGMTDVALNSRVRVRFDEIINTEILDGLTLTYGGQTHPVRYELTADKQEVIIVPISLLPAQTTITLNIAGIKDLSGNQVASSSFSFTTEVSIDTTAGTLVSYSPLNNSDVSTNAVVTAIYSERVDFSSVIGGDNNFRVKNFTQNRYVEGNYSISADGKELSFHVDGEYVLGDKYGIYFTGIRDIAGNIFGNAGYYYFIPTEDTDNAAPSYINGNILDGMTGVALNTPIKLFFDEQLSMQCVNSNSIKLMIGGTEVDSDITLDATRTQITIEPTDDLVANSSYQVVVDGLCDVAGNTLTAYSRSFTTGTALDTTAPNISSISPAHNATDVSVNTAIVMTFDETIDPTNTASNFRFTVNGSSNYISGDFAFNDNVVTFTPHNPLPGNSQIDVYLGSYRDIAGNSRCCHSYKFFTQAGADTQGPQVTSITPADGAMGIGVNTPVVLTYNESLSSTTVNSTNFKLYSDGNVITPTVTRSLDGRTVTLRGTWPAGSLMTVFATNEVKDLSNNSMADFASVFTTAMVDTDNTRPSVVRQYPVTGATDVRDITSVTIYTNEPMNVASINNALTVVQDGVIMPGAISISDNGQGITFSPTSAFAQGSLIHVYLSTDATDDSGNAVNAYQGNFTMGADSVAGVRPTQLSYIPVNNATDVPVNGTIQIAYNQQLNAGFVTGSYIGLKVADNNSSVPINLSLSADKRLVTLTPTAALQTNTRYYIETKANLEDIDGDTQYYTRKSYFTTSTSAAIDNQGAMVTAMSPGNNAQNVALNPLYHIRFDEPINPLSVSSATGMSIAFNSDNTEMTYLKHQPLAANTSHIETALTSKDMAGNVTASHSESFTTGNDADVVVPNYASRLPDASQQIAPNSAVVWIMDEVINPLSVNNSTVEVQDVDDGYNQVAGIVSLAADGRTITWVAQTGLLANRNYRGKLGAVTDLSGNVNSTDYHSFSTSSTADNQAPSVVATSVTQGITDVPLNSRIRVLFDEVIDRNNLVGLTINYGATSHELDYSISASGKEVTIIPRQLLPAQTSVTLNITGISDPSGNVIAPSSVTFNTATSIDTQVGTLQSYSPLNNSEVATTTPISVTYTERVDFTSVIGADYNFRVYNVTQGVDVAGSYTISADGKQLIFTPDSQWTPAERYRFYLTGIRDIAGNTFGSVGYYYFDVAM